MSTEILIAVIIELWALSAMMGDDPQKAVERPSFTEWTEDYAHDAAADPPKPPPAPEPEPEKGQP
jgi:hypothetical protein